MFFICILLPAIISVIIDEKINHSKKTIRDLVLMYGGYLFIITLFMNTIFCFIESDVWFYNNEIFTYQFCTKYMWISFIISIILPYIRFPNQRSTISCCIFLICLTSSIILIL